MTYVILRNLPILRYDKQPKMRVSRLLAVTKSIPHLQNQPVPKRAMRVVDNSTFTRVSDRIDSAMKRYLFSDEIHEQSTTISAIEWKKTIADIVNQTTSLSDNDQLMQLMELANFISQLSDEEIIALLSKLKRPAE